MEFLVAKVKYGNGLRFHPLLEEKVGWIYGEAPMLSVEMMKVVIKNMTQGNKQGAEGTLNLFRERPREILSKDAKRNYSGLLVRKMQSRSKLTMRSS